ncbi:alpha/beta fold hydrolase [Maritimibacter alkaliphilus]|uniref:alpha/beta fold hydrolase n=1 Tax=Maritimibacter alkaliphilus TaxID=404236 RepID=UPI001C96EDD2|nr:alpha/beta hydrolase [Maritimibacter alkaliphilus]MBY6092578.1 alpha/beta hydrolase [Maritimibacter alkaliphilus]
MQHNLSVVVDGARVVYDRNDHDGRPVIFVHGGFGSSSELWHLTMDSLPEGICGYAINNFLRSDAPPEGYTIEALATRVAHFAQALGLEKPVIVGHSMGGVVCQTAAIRYPEIIGGAVLIGTGPTMRNHITGQALLEQMRAANGISEELMRSISAKWFYKEPPEGFFDAYVARAMTAPMDAVIEVQASLLETDLVDELPKLVAPTLVLHPTEDSGRPLEHAELLMAGIPDARLHIFEDCGHSPMLEAKDEFDTVFHAFLRETLAPLPTA